MGGSARGCWAERIGHLGSRRDGDRVGLVGYAERSAKNRSEERPLHAGRIRHSWEAGEFVAMGRFVGLAEVASGEWRVASLKKKQFPRCARNDNSRTFGRAVTQVAGSGFVERRVGVILVRRIRGRAPRLRSG
jgi:hypothetical protein